MHPMNPPWRRHDAHRFIRHDAHRFFTPLGNERRRAAQAEEERKAQQADAAAEIDAAELAALRAAHERLRIELADVKFALALRRLRYKYSEDQPRVPAGSPDGGQWTSGGEGTDGPEIENEPLAQDSLPTARNQTPRDDLSQLQAVANDPLIRQRIDEAWAASNPNSARPQEHGFWIVRNEVTGELFIRPFANPGSFAQIVPGPAPSDAVAFFHTHPNRPDADYFSGPSPEDQNFARRVGLPGLIQSHGGMYYFGPRLRSIRLR